jgi:hypothetical protein
VGQRDVFLSVARDQLSPEIKISKVVVVVTFSKRWPLHCITSSQHIAPRPHRTPPHLHLSTTHARTMAVVGELLFTGMTDWKNVGRGKTSVRERSRIDRSIDRRKLPARSIGLRSEFVRRSDL